LLGKRKHATSTHVYREWKRIVDAGCADVLNVLRDDPTDVDEVLARLSAGFGRSAAQSLRVLNLVSAGQGLDATLEIRARAFLRYRSRNLFHHNIGTVRDGSECGLARNEVQQDSSGHWQLIDRCKKTDEICREDEFLGDEATRADAAARALVDKSEREPDRKMGRAMLKMLPVPRDRKGKNCYWQTGDIAIALECDADETLLTTDRSFEVICPAIHRRVHRLKSTSPPASSSASTPTQ
jgi:hypothetical protein